MRAVVLVGALLLEGCQSATEKAEQEQKMVEKTGDEDAICAAKKKTADAWLSAHDDGKYQMAKLSADAYCESVRLTRANLL